MKSTLFRVSAPIFVTDRLQDRIFEAREFADTASGILCFTASRSHDFHVIWFRTKQVQVVKWGGEPTKAVEFDGTRKRLSPRRSSKFGRKISRQGGDLDPGGDRGGCGTSRDVNVSTFEQRRIEPWRCLAPQRGADRLKIALFKCLSAESEPVRCQLRARKERRGRQQAARFSARLAASDLG